MTPYKVVIVTAAAKHARLEEIHTRIARRQTAQMAATIHKAKQVHNKTCIKAECSQLVQVSV